MTEAAEEITLDAKAAEQVRRDDAAAFADAASPPEGGAPAPPSPTPTSEPTPNAVALDLASMDAEDAENLLELLALVMDDKPTALKRGSIWWAPDEKERKKLGKPLARVAAKWLPGLVTAFPDEVALGVAVILIGAGRVAEVNAYEKERREREEDDRNAGGRA